MASGNPAKRAQEKKAKATVDEVKAASRAGRSMVLYPFPNTKAVITSTDPEEAEAVVRALQPMPTVGDIGMAELQTLLHQVGFMFRAYALEPRYAKEIDKWLVDTTAKLAGTYDY